MRLLEQNLLSTLEDNESRIMRLVCNFNQKPNSLIGCQTQPRASCHTSSNEVRVTKTLKKQPAVEVS